jgi:hypothetical protein
MFVVCREKSIKERYYTLQSDENALSQVASALKFKGVSAQQVMMMIFIHSQKPLLSLSLFSLGKRVSFTVTLQQVNVTHT